MDQPVKVLQKKNAFFTSTGIFPLFRHHNIELSDFDDVRGYFSGKEKTLDSHLTLSEKIELYAYEHYVKESLYPCLQYAWWVDEKNFNESIRPIFAKTMTLPFNYYYLNQLKKTANDVMDVLYGDYYEPFEIYHEIYRKADSFFSSISSRLANNEFFFGKKPSSLDAILFAYLAPILKVPLKNPILSNHVKKYENLVRYVHRITRLYFYETDNVYIAECEKNAASSKNKSGDKKDLDRVKNIFLAIIFASVAMLGYAHSNGLVLKNLSDGPSDYNDMLDTDDDDH